MINEFLFSSSDPTLSSLSVVPNQIGICPDIPLSGLFFVWVFWAKKIPPDDGIFILQDAL
jgi:hypothetical protein